MKGVPLRIEAGPRDVENKNVVLVRRDTGEKFFIPNDEAMENIPKLLGEIQKGLFVQALEFRKQNTHAVKTYKELKDVIEKGGFVRCGWDGTNETEAKVKEETRATIRCIPSDENPKGLTCVFSGNPAKHEVIYAKAY